MAPSLLVTKFIPPSGAQKNTWLKTKGLNDNTVKNFKQNSKSALRMVRQERSLAREAPKNEFAV